MNPINCSSKKYYKYINTSYNYTLNILDKIKTSYSFAKNCLLLEIFIGMKIFFK